MGTSKLQAVVTQQTEHSVSASVNTAVVTRAKQTDTRSIYTLCVTSVCNVGKEHVGGNEEKRDTIPSTPQTTFTRYNRLSNRFDNWLYRVNKRMFVYMIQPVVKAVERTTTVRSPGCQTGLTTGCIV